MTTRLSILVSILAVCLSCGRQVEPQYVAGYITEINDAQITLNVIDSISSVQRFTLDSNTICDEGSYYEGNIAEVKYMPAEKEDESAHALSVTSDPTYPRVRGRWQTDKDDKLQIDIILQPYGKISQLLPTEILQFTNWQITGVENEIILQGTLSLPPSREEGKKGGSEDEDIAAQRRTMYFKSKATLADDKEGNTEQHKVLIITTDKGRQSKLYPAGR